MKKATIFILVTLIASIVLISCNNAENTKANSKPTFDLAAAKNEIAEVNKTFMEMVVNGDSTGIANLYTTDAKLMFTGMPAVVGRQGIQSVFGEIVTSGVTKVDIRTTEVFGTEDMLAEEGELTIYVQDNPVAEEKFIVLWKKEDGKWKLFRDIANSNAPN